ncbi:MAG: dimethylarginine dimethylaminohydrolase family protein [Nitrospinota bacterium]
MPLDPSRIPGYVKGQPPDRTAMSKLTFMDELEAIWGRRWGAQSKIGKLDYALVCPPTENEASPETFEDPAFYLLPDGPPDLPKMKKQYKAFEKALRENGVELEVWELPDVAEGAYSRMRLLWAPASCFVINGGAIIPRNGLAPWRHGHEALKTKKLASLGCPILHTIRGGGVMESGGNVIFLDPHHALVGTGASGNEEGFRQIKAVLSENGVREIHPVQFKDDIHLDLVFGLADAWLALVYPPGFDGKTMDYLTGKGIQLIEVSDEEHRNSACNVLALEPGKVLMVAGNPRAAEALRERNVTVIELEMSEYVKTGGGPHCATGCLIRDPGPLLP